MNDLAQLVPSSITVVYVATGSGSPQPPFYAVNVTLTSLALPQYANITGSPWAHTLHRYDVAQYAGAGTPTNAATLLALAKQMATDWYLWQLARLDQQIDGDFNWNPEGLHEIEWRQARGRITTRVIRGPFKPLEDLMVPLPVAKGSNCAIRDRTICVNGTMVYQISQDCGTTWTSIANLGVSCPECRIPLPPDQKIRDINCEGLDLIKYFQTRTYFYDASGCERAFDGPLQRVKIGCCAPCSSTASSSVPSSSSCPGPVCDFCLPGTTPYGWTFSLTCDPGGGGTSDCSNCTAGSPTDWTFTGAGFTGDFAQFNGAADLTNTGEFVNCVWEKPPPGNIYTLGVASVGGAVPKQIVIILEMFGADGETTAEYRSTPVVADTIDCCVPYTLNIYSHQGAGTLPATIVVTPHNCGAAACTPDPSGNWTLGPVSASNSCCWIQVRSDGVTATFCLFQDPETGDLIFELTIHLSPFGYTLYFVYVVPDGQDPFNCNQPVTVQLLDQTGCLCVPDDKAFSITLTPILLGPCGGSTSPCCTGRSTPMPNTLYVTFNGTLNSLGKVAMSKVNSTTWQANVNACGLPDTISFVCNNSNDSWQLSSLGSVIGGGVPGIIPYSCEPFSWTLPNAPPSYTPACTALFFQTFGAVVTET